MTLSASHHSQFIPQQAISFEFAWRGLSSLSEHSKIQGINIQFSEDHQYEITIPKSSIDSTTLYLIPFCKKNLSTKEAGFIACDYIKISGKLHLNRMSMLAKIITIIPVNPTKTRFPYWSRNNLPQPIHSEEKISLDLSMVRPGYHYEILVTTSGANIEAKLIEKNLFKTSDKRSIEEYKFKHSSQLDINSKIAPLIQALDLTDPNRFDTKFTEIISLGREMLKNLAAAALTDEAKEKQLNIIFLGTLISAYSFHRWKEGGNNDFQSLYFWLITAGMARVITGDNARDNEHSPYRDPNHAVYDLKTNFRIFTRMILVIGNQFLNNVQRFKVETYLEAFRNPLLQKQITKIIEVIAKETPADFFEQQEDQINELIKSHHFVIDNEAAVAEFKEIEEKFNPSSCCMQ